MGRWESSPGWNSRPKPSCLLHLPTSGTTHYLSPRYNHTQWGVRFGCAVYEPVSECVFLFAYVCVCISPCLYRGHMSSWCAWVCFPVFSCAYRRGALHLSVNGNVRITSRHTSHHMSPSPTYSPLLTCPLFSLTEKVTDAFVIPHMNRLYPACPALR